jgi:broad specificity phosphatase PhoE
MHGFVMTTFLLVRHCAVDALGRYLAGRAPGEGLNATGRAELRALADRVANLSLDAVFSSPLERARETAAAFAPCIDGDVEYADELLEVDFGEWTGKTFEALSEDPRWAAFNTHRSITRIPGGELMLETQARVVAFLQRVAERWPSGHIAIVSHGDVLRAAIAYYLGLSLDHLLRFELSPASMSVLEVGSSGARLLTLNVSAYANAPLLG